MAGSAVVGTLRALLVADTAQFDRAMQRSNDSLKVWSKELKKTGEQATQLGATLTKTLTLPLAALGVGAIKLATDFETGFANVRKTVQATEPEFAQLTATIRTLAKTIPIATDELNKIAAIGGQMGVATKDLAKFTQTIALLGVAVDGISTEEAATSLAQIGNAAGIGMKDIDKMASTLVHLGNTAAATEGQILEFTKRLVGAGSSIGLTVPEVMALGTAMANVGINAEAGGSAMSKVLSDMGKAVSAGGDQLKEFARVADLSAGQFAEKFRTKPMEAIEAFIRGLGSMKARGVDLNLTMGEIGETGIRVEDTLKRLAGGAQGLTDAMGNANVAWKDGTKHVKEAEEKFKTTANQMKLLWQQIQDVGITIGNALLPALRWLTGALTSLVPLLDSMAKWFASLPAGAQLLAIGLGVVAAAAGPLLVLFGQLLIAAGAVTQAFAAQGIATRGLATAQTALGLSSTALRAALPLLSTALLGVGAAAFYAFSEISALQAKQRAWEAEMAERTRLVAAATKVFGEAAAKQIDFSKWTRAQRDDLLGLSAATKDTTFSLSGMGDQLGLVVTRTTEADKATAQYTGRVTLSKEEQEKAAAAAKKHREEIERLVRAYTREGVALQIQELAVKVALLQKHGTLTTKALEEFTRQIAEWVEEGYQVPPILHDMLVGNLALAKALIPVKDTTKEVLEITRQLSFAQLAARYSTAGLGDELKSFSAVIATSPLGGGLAKTLGIDLPVARTSLSFAELAAPQIKAAEEALKRAAAWAETLGRMIGSIYDEISAGFTDMLVAGLSGAQSFADGFVNIWEGLKRQLASIFGDILNLFVNGLLRGMVGYLLGNRQAFGQAFAGMAGTGGQSLLSTALGLGGTGAAAAALPGPAVSGATLFGTGAGSAAGGAAAGGLGSAGMLGAVGGSVAGGAAGGAVGYYVGYRSGSTAGGIAAGAGTGAGVGMLLGGPIGAGVGAGVGALAGWYGAVQAGKKINDIRDAFAVSQGGMDAIQQRLIAMGRSELWQPFAHGERNIDKFKEALGKIQEVFEKADKAAKQLAEDQKKWIDAATTGFGKLNLAVQKYGTVLPKALRDTIAPLLESKDLTKEWRDELEGLAADPSWRTLQGIAEKYGIALSGLGATFQKARITDIALEYARDWQVLIDSGADLTAIVTGVQDELNALYLDAKKNGVALPETLRPYMQRLVDLGLLVDENGDKITDLNGITFENIEDKLLTQVVDVLKEIRDILAKGLPQAAAAGAQGIQDAFDRNPIRIPITFDDPGHVLDRTRPPWSQDGVIDTGAEPERPAPELGLQGGTHGQYVDWGSGTAVTLHGKERVATEGEAFGGAGATYITVISQLDGREVARNQVRHIPRALQLAGL